MLASAMSRRCRAPQLLHARSLATSFYDVKTNYGNNILKPSLRVQKKKPATPFPTYVGTWHDDKWVPPVESEHFERPMDAWNNSPYDPPDPWNRFLEERAELLMDSSSPSAKMLYLNRRETLNAFDLDFVRKIGPLVKKYGNQVETSFITFIGGYTDTACSTGTDYVELYNRSISSDPRDHMLAEEYIVTLYKMIADAYFSKAPVSLVAEGLTLGSAATLFAATRHSVTTDLSVVCWPETGMGFFPDAGASYFLSRLPDAVGMYLALTGARLEGSSAMKAGLCPFHIDRTVLDVARLGVEKQWEKSRVKGMFVMDSYNCLSTSPYALLPYIETIQECFSKPSVPEIFEALEKDGSDWALKQIQKLNSKSPLSLVVTHRALTEAKDLDLESCLKRDFAIAKKLLKHTDFEAGMKSLVLGEATQGDCNWLYKSVGSVPKEEVDAIFSYSADDIKALDIANWIARPEKEEEIPSAREQDVLATRARMEEEVESNLATSSNSLTLTKEEYEFEDIKELIVQQAAISVEQFENLLDVYMATDVEVWSKLHKIMDEAEDTGEIEHVVAHYYNNPPPSIQDPDTILLGLSTSTEYLERELGAPRVGDQEPVWKGEWGDPVYSDNRREWDEMDGRLERVGDALFMDEEELQDYWNNKKFGRQVIHHLAGEEREDALDRKGIKGL